jgi:uridine phosphorylase
MLGIKRVTILSTGMGTDNIDIVLNELDALVNIDFETRTIKKDIRSLEIIRLGTSGAVSDDIPLDSIVISEAAIGIDNLMSYYRHSGHVEETLLAEAFRHHIHVALPYVYPYTAFADAELVNHFEPLGRRGVTVTAPGFFGPQGRQLRTINQSSDIISLIHQFKHLNYHIANLEMETAGIYALGKHLGHRCVSLNAILAHRIDNTFSSDPQKVIDSMIVKALDIIAS